MEKDMQTYTQKVEVRNLRMSDYMELKKSMIEAYSNWQGAYWRAHHIQSLLEIFPEGQICVLINGQVGGSALSLIVNYNQFGDDHTYRQITGNFTFDTHNPEVIHYTVSRFLFIRISVV